jgi:ABC-type uncharacterized transport system substrate-binding protein
MINNNNIKLENKKELEIDYLDDLVIYFSKLREKEKKNRNIDSLSLYRKYLYVDNKYRSKL